MPGPSPFEVVADLRRECPHARVLVVTAFDDDAYVRGLVGAGIVATLKHFAGYSASRAGRNLAPVSIGPRELADVVLPPFEAALRLGGARSVMASYTDTDGMPAAAHAWWITPTIPVGPS